MRKTKIIIGGKFMGNYLIDTFTDYEDYEEIQPRMCSISSCSFTPGSSSTGCSGCNSMGCGPGSCSSTGNK